MGRRRGRFDAICCRAGRAAGRGHYQRTKASPHPLVTLAAAATRARQQMASKRPRPDNGGAADASEGGSCQPCEAAAPSVPSSSGRGLRKRPWEEEGFRCPFLDTINRTLLDFGVLLAPPHASRLRSHRQLPSRSWQISRRPAPSLATILTCTRASCVASTSKAVARTLKPTRTRSRCVAPSVGRRRHPSVRSALRLRARRRAITCSRTCTTARSTACLMATRWSTSLCRCGGMGRARDALHRVEQA